MLVSNRAWSLPHSTKSAEQRAASNEEAKRKPAGLERALPGKPSTDCPPTGQPAHQQQQAAGPEQRGRPGQQAGDPQGYQRRLELTRQTRPAGARAGFEWAVQRARGDGHDDKAYRIS